MEKQFIEIYENSRNLLWLSLDKWFATLKVQVSLPSNAGYTV